MKNLLSKELKLCVPTQTWIFVALSMCICIPSWPVMTSYIYVIAGFMPLFPIALANRDLLYTSILPVKKTDVVKGKVLLMCFLQLVSILWSIPFAVLKVFMSASLPPEDLYPELGVNPALFGFILVMFMMFNLIYVPWYYKKPDTKNAAAQLVSMFACMIYMGIITAVFIAVPGLADFINNLANPVSLGVNIGILAVGLLLFIGGSALANYLGGKAFQKVDL